MSFTKKHTLFYNVKSLGLKDVASRARSHSQVVSHSRLEQGVTLKLGAITPLLLTESMLLFKLQEFIVPSFDFYLLVHFLMVITARI